ncbi:hypothetical protein GW17_00036172 [Ensete ventricosum]|nr:hypothetical protein GW17_00036172 [Ensete ventricosum]
MDEAVMDGLRERRRRRNFWGVRTNTFPMRRAVRSGGVSLGGLEEEEGREEGEQKTQPLSRRLRSLESPLRPPRRELTLR